MGTEHQLKFGPKKPVQILHPTYRLHIEIVESKQPLLQVPHFTGSLVCQGFPTFLQVLSRFCLAGSLWITSCRVSIPLMVSA